MAAGEPSDGAGRRPRRGWWIAAGLLALLLVVGLLVVLWVKAPDLYRTRDAEKSAVATANTRAGILTLGAAIAAGLVAWMSLAETRRANTEIQRLTEQGHLTDRYTKAIDQLGSGKLDVRLGGIYGLERIAVDSTRDHPTVVEVLSAYVRQHTDPTQQGSTVVQDKPTPRPPADVQAALTVLGRLRSRPGVPRGDLSDARLAGAQLNQLNLTDAVLNGADLTGAQLNRANLANTQLNRANLGSTWLNRANLANARLNRANLDNARLNRANMANAQLGKANLTNAHLSKVNLTSAWLSGAKLTDADLFEADLTNAQLLEANLTTAWLFRANLTGTQLGGANLTDAQLGEANLTGAWLSGAHLAAAKNLTQQQLDSARGDDETKLPAGLQRPAHWSTGPATDQ